MDALGVSWYISNFNFKVNYPFKLTKCFIGLFSFSVSNIVQGSTILFNFFNKMFTIWLSFSPFLYMNIFSTQKNLTVLQKWWGFWFIYSNLLNRFIDRIITILIHSLTLFVGNSGSESLNHSRARLVSSSGFGGQYSSSVRSDSSVFHFSWPGVLNPRGALSCRV